MTTYPQHLNRSASPEQIALLRRLALSRGVSFSPPTSSADASRQIDRLLAAERSPVDELDRERQLIREDLAAGGGAVALIQDDEIGGFGSTAHWR
jgi:hypothetical protein